MNRQISKKQPWAPVLFSAVLAGVIGCGSQAPSTPAAESSEQATASGHDHSGWWCTEHGVPEEVCALCNSKVAAEFQKNGDWCEEHNRPDSQCFICHPEKEAEFAAEYEARYGEKPPKRTE